MHQNRRDDSKSRSEFESKFEFISKKYNYFEIRQIYSKMVKFDRKSQIFDQNRRIFD